MQDENQNQTQYLWVICTTSKGDHIANAQIDNHRSPSNQQNYAIHRQKAKTPPQTQHLRHILPDPSQPNHCTGTPQDDPDPIKEWDTSHMLWVAEGCCFGGAEFRSEFGELGAEVGEFGIAHKSRLLNRTCESTTLS